MGNNIQKKRIIKTFNAQRRLTKEEKLQLKEAFNRIQESQVINEYQFRLEVLGPQVPETIALKIFELFTSEDKEKQVLNYDDVINLFAVFKYGQPEEIGQLCFEMLKLLTGAELMRKEQFGIFAERIGAMGVQKKSGSELKFSEAQFYEMTKFDPRLPINREEFVKAFKKVKDFPIFNWLPHLVDGYSKDNMNIDDTRTSDLARRLTSISNEKSKLEVESMGFDSKESDNLQNFFQSDIKKNDPKEVVKSKQLDAKTFSNLVFFICKETVESKKLEFLFDIFSASSEILKKGGQIGKIDFVEDLSSLMDFTIYEKTKYIMIAMIGLNATNEEEQRETILAALENNHKIESYIYDHLDDEPIFYIIDKTFWDSWSLTVCFNEDKTVTLKKEKVKTINNSELMEQYHELRMKETTYNENFVIVPKYVFNALQKWYTCNKVIERKVISYKQNRLKLSLIKHKKGNLSHSKSNVLQSLPDQFSKTILDTIYELEIYPKFIYYEKINDKGEKPHQKAIVNQKIDQNYMKKVIKSDKIPFQELLLSRKTTFEEVLKIISSHYKEQHKKGRLWIEDQVISGPKLEETLEDFGISIGQVIYVEYASNNNIWPSDKNSALATRQEEKKDQNKTGGLYNLGNSNLFNLIPLIACYMNSALQCLANTKFFYDYFVKQQRYTKQMNLKSKEGFNGELAQNFAQLMEKLWTTQNAVVYPKPFKGCISNISEQFQGYDQQDSQEFLSFLLDGLHEELNLRQQKPYLENPDSDDRKILELGLESWSNSLSRDWSFIFFLFYGQLKSTLNCKICNKVSTTFDNFTNIALSLPEPTKILLHVVVYRLPNEVKDIIQGKHKQSALNRMESARSDDNFRGGINSQHGERDLAKFQETFKYMTNDQPIHICLRVDKDIKISSLIQMICEVKDVNIDPLSFVSQVVLYSTSKSSVRGIFNTEYKLTQYNLLTNEIDAIEVLTKKGRDLVRNYYLDNNQYMLENPDAHLQCLTQVTEKVENKVQRKGVNQKIAGKAVKEDTYGVKIEKGNLFNNYGVAYEKFNDFDENGNFPDEIYVVAYHRRFIKKNYYFFQPYQPQLFANPLILILPLKPSGKRIYEEIWAVAHTMLKKNSIYHQKQNLWWEQKNWQEMIKSKDSSIFKPFVIKTIERSGYSCSQCSWMEMCSGCILPPSEDFNEDFFRKCHLAIEWNSSLMEDDYNQAATEVLQHTSTTDKNIQEEDQVNLEDCLRKFQEVEDLGSQNNIYCSSCKKHEEHLKKLEIFRPPPILIIQLKRFKFSSTHKYKLMTLVEFPLYNLDLASFVTDQQFLKDQGIDQTYDLYGIINHYGNLSFGHYISVIKNENDGKWYKYDDSSRTQIPEEQVVKDDAYILFYIRKDLHDKKLEHILPNIKDLFPGKPIKTEQGDGFVISKKGQDKYEVQIKKQSATELISKGKIFEEKDDNEIHYDEKQLQEIEHQKKEKLNELIKKQKTLKKRRICACFYNIGFLKSMNEKAYQKRRNKGNDSDDDEPGGICNIF